MPSLTAELTVLQSRALSYNAGVFTSGTAAVLIDPGLYPDEIDRIRAHVYERGAQPVAIVITHSHWDHVLGPEYFPGAPVVQQAESLGVLHEFGAQIERQVTEWERQSGVGRELPFVIPEPDQTFPDELDLPVGDTALKLVHTPGHAPEHLSAYHAGTGMLWAGDMLSDIEIPFVMQSLAEYRGTLVHLSRLDVRVLVPGHGRATSDPAEIRDRFSRDVSYLSELSDLVSATVKAGDRAADALRACAHMHVREGNEWPHRKNIETAFIELGGEPEPEHAGWDRLQ
jgi:glyoxylase-like metal-dependent hydrolase (beta-lactamase superfamily II)